MPVKKRSLLRWRTRHPALMIQADTAKKLADLRTQMEVDMQAKLSKQKSDAEETLRQMEDSYAAHHTEYAQALFRTMTER